MLAFEDAGERIEQALARAARTGEVNFENLVSSILADLARLAAFYREKRPDCDRFAALENHALTLKEKTRDS